MRVLNDKKSEQTSPSELSFFSVVTYTVLTALGFTTIFFAPLPLIVAHERMEEPWPKVTALLGALLALTYLEVQVSLVAGLFVFALFVADKVKHGIGLWGLLAQSAVAALLVGSVAVSVSAYREGTQPLAFWDDATRSLIDGVEALFLGPAQKNFDWEGLRQMLFYQGPFLLLSVGMLATWLSVGVAAHLGWLPATHPLSGEKLRAIRLPAGIALAFAGTLLGSFFDLGGWQNLLGGLSRILATALFVQGCAFFSGALAQKSVSIRMRTLFYIFAIVFGFYAVIGMGVAGPWLLSKRKGKGL